MILSVDEDEFYLIQNALLTLIEHDPPRHPAYIKRAETLREKLFDQRDKNEK